MARERRGTPRVRRENCSACGARMRAGRCVFCAARAREAVAPPTSRRRPAPVRRGSGATRSAAFGAAIALASVVGAAVALLSSEPPEEVEAALEPGAAFDFELIELDAGADAEALDASEEAVSFSE